MLVAAASSTTTSTSPAPSTPPVLPNIPTVPGFTPINTDLAPEKSFLRELCTKVANHWTSTFHSSRHLDNLEKVGQFIPKMQEPIAAWAALVTSTANTPVGAMIAVVGGTVGTLIRNGAKDALATIDKFNSGLKDITGYELSTLTGEKRRELSTEQRAKVSALYTSLKGDFTKGEKKYSEISTTINSIVKSVNAAVETFNQNNKIRDRLKDGYVPQTEGEIAVTVTQETLNTVNTWFTEKADAAEAAIQTTLGKITPERLEASDEATKTFAQNSKEYRNTVQAIGKAILPFDTLAKTPEATELFNDTVGKLKDIVEQATVGILGKGESHEVTMGKLEKLQELSAKIAADIKDELHSLDGLTEEEKAELILMMGSAVKDIITPPTPTAQSRVSKLFAL